MRLDEVAICNIAIGMCGSTDFIQSLTDTDSVSARRCNQFFTPAVEAVLRKHDWNCATNISLLAENSTAPIFKYDNSFALPVDCVRVIQVYGDDAGYSSYDRWEIRGRDIHTDLDTVYLQYVQMPDDYKELDILLSGAIAGELAQMLASGLVKDPDALSLVFQLSQRKANEAKAIDSLENKYIDVEASIWNDARVQGVST